MFVTYTICSQGKNKITEERNSQKGQVATINIDIEVVCLISYTELKIDE